MVLGIETGTTGVSRWYVRVVKTVSRFNPGEFNKDQIISGAKVKTDFWSRYKGMKVHFPKLPREKLENHFKQIHWVIMRFTMPGLGIPTIWS